MYKCLKCRKEVDPKKVKEKVRCPYCGYKIILKEASETVVKVKAD
ncbi:MAG: DNA-directed RNA polymerase subunit P [Candidatus Aenigmatarchaeota archaeon]